MAGQLVLGVDPGLAGALAVILDGQFVEVHDLPTRLRRAGRNEIDGYALGHLIRSIEERLQPVQKAAVFEDVSAMPPKKARDAKPCEKCGAVEESGMGATSAFQFGRSAGAVQYPLEVMGYAVHLVQAQKWKRDSGLSGTKKDYALTVAAQCYPSAAPRLVLKKHVGRAEAILIARWGDKNQIYRVERAKQLELE